MTADFVHDAADSMAKSEMDFMLIAAFPGSSYSYQIGKVPSRIQLDWMKNRFAELCERLEKQFAEQA